MTKRLAELLKKSTAALTAAALVITAPGLPLYAQFNEVGTAIVTTPGSGQAVPIVGGNPAAGVVIGGAADSSGGALRKGVGSMRFGKKGFSVKPEVRTAEERQDVSVSEDEAVSEEVVATSQDHAAVTAVEETTQRQATHESLQQRSIIINADERKQPALKRLAKPSVVQTLAPRSTPEQAMTAGAEDFRRISGEAEGYVSSPSPALRATSPRSAEGGPAFGGKRGEGNIEGSAPVERVSSYLKVAAEQKVSAAVPAGSYIKEERVSTADSGATVPAVQAWENEVALDAAGFVEKTVVAAMVTEKAPVYKDAPAAQAFAQAINQVTAGSPLTRPFGATSPVGRGNEEKATIGNVETTVVPDISSRKNRSVIFPAVLSAVSLTGWSLAKLVPHVAGWTLPLAGGSTVQPIQFWHHMLQMGATGLMYTVGAFLAWTVAEFILYGVMTRVGKSVTPAEAAAFLQKDAKAHPDLYRGLLGVRPGTGILKFSFSKEVRPFGVFAFTLPNSIYMRPELTRMPVLFRIVLRHELHHFKNDLGRAPPARGFLGKARNIFSEAGAHLFELFPASGRLPQGYLLERVLNQAQASLRLTSSYDVLLAARETNAIGENDFKWISEGKARVRTLRGADSAKLAEKTREALRDPQNAGKYRALLIDDVKGWLPQGQDLKQLEMTFRKMEQVYQERIIQQKARPMSSEPKKAGASELWSKVRNPSVEKLELVKFFDDLYRSMQDKGVILLPFAPGDANLGPVERMFRHWATHDKGYFRTTRVDLAEGGHVLVAVKTEPRVRVYLKPTNGAKVAGSIAAVYRDPVKQAAAQSVLKHIGLEQWLPTFNEIGLEVVHVQGEDTGDTMVYVSVPRASVRYIEALVKEKKVDLVKSVENFEPHSAPAVRNGLNQAVPRQNSAEAWKTVGGAKGMVIYSDDTGAWAGHPYFNGRVTAEDVTDEGPEDWHGHGTQTMGDALAGGDNLKGPAFEATGVMVKVFPKGSGASDGDIRAGWGKAQQGGADVLYMSLGSQGSPDSPLSRDASGLTKRKNSKGEYPIVIASAGNSGPDAETIGQPAAGDEVIAVAAATKGEDADNPSKSAKLEIALYSSAGWAWYGHGYGLNRPILKPEITGEVGTVNTPDEKGDVYKYGMTSPKSNNAEPTPADSSDGLETRAAGTSMSAPQAAGAAALVKKALKNVADKVTGWVWENLPFSVKMLMMVSSEDMRAPVQKMGAGLMDFGAAVKAAQGNLSWIQDARKAVDLPRQVFEAAGVSGKDAEGVVRASPEAQLKARIAARAAARKILSMFGKENRTAARLVAAQTAQLAAAKAMSQEIGAVAQKAASTTFKAESAKARPELARLLKHEVWVVRFYAAFAYLGLKDIEALPLLAEVAATDSDARVRQLALQAIAETPSKSVDDKIQPLLKDPALEIRAYAALVLARHGKPDAVNTLIELSKNGDKQIRYTASWVMGYIGKAADSSVTEALSAIAATTTERDSNRHEAIAALGRLVENSQAFTPKVFADLLGSAGTQELIVTRTVLNSFFAKAAQDSAMKKVMTAEPTKRSIVAFIEKYRAASQKRGGLGDLVRLLARVTGTEVGSPAPVDPSGQGIPGVDDNLGPVHLIIELPAGKQIDRTVLNYGNAVPAEAMTDALAGVAFPMDVVAALGANVRSVMKEGFVGVEIPAYSVPAFTQQMQLKGFLVNRAGPKFMYLKDTGPLSGLPAIHGEGVNGVGSVGLVIDEGLDTSNGAFAGKILGTVNTSGDGAATDVNDESVGHGTHTGNIAAGSPREDGNPNIGRAPGAFVIAAKVLGKMGGSETTVMEGVSGAMQIVDDVNAKLKTYWTAVDGASTEAKHKVPQPDGEAIQNAIKQGIRRFVPALNLSLGGPGKKDSPLNVQLRRLHIDGGAMVNVAAGNDGPGDGTANESSPGNEWSIKSIGALKKDGSLVFYSSRGTPSEPMRILGHYGGDADLEGAACPFIPGGIISALAAKIAEDVSKCIVPHNGKPTDQAMSGTSMASPHSNGDDLLLLQAFRKLFSDDEVAAMKGWTLWLDELAFSSMSPVPGTKPHEVQGKREIKAELAALAERGKDKAKVAAEALELYKKAKERDGKESTLRWAGVGATAIRRGIWASVWEALKAPFGKALAKAISAATPRNGFAAKHSVPELQAARDLAELRGLREILSTGAGVVTPFVFHLSDKEVEAPAAGLEAFFFTKSRLESQYGPDALLGHVADSFSYLDTLLASQDWTAGLREELTRLAADARLSPAQKNAALNEALTTALVALRTRVATLDKAAWSRDARVYELFPRAYNLRDKRLAGSRLSRFRQKIADRLIAWGWQKPKPFFADVTTADLKQIRGLGFDAVWAMGVHPIGERNRWGDAGGSPYSIKDYTAINPELGTMDDYRAFVKKAHKAGLKVIADFVPNHSSMDSKTLAEHPEYFVSQEAGAGDAPKGYFAYEQASTGKKFWVHHGGFDSWGNMDTWTDTAQLDYSREDTRAAMAGAAREFMEATGVDGYRVDMAYQILNAPFAKLWGKSMPRREFLEQLAVDLKTARPGFALIAEAYANQDTLSAAGFDVIYNKSDSRKGGQEGFYDALVSKDPATLERALRRVAYLAWQKGGATGLDFSTNHDEPAPARAFGKWMKSALFLSMFLPGAQLVYGSQEIGFDQPAPGEPKSIPFSVARKVDWLGADATVVDFYKAMFRQAIRMRAALPQPEMSVLDGGGKWVGYALASKGADTVFAVIANPTDAEQEVRIVRPDLGIQYGVKLAANDSIVVSFPAPVAVAPSMKLKRLVSAYPRTAQVLSFFAFFAFLPMMIPQIQMNWANYHAGNLEALKGVSYPMMALGITGNLFNFSAFLMSRNPWFIFGCFAGISTTWVALVPLYLAHIIPSAAFLAASGVAGVFLAASIAGYFLHRKTNSTR